MHESEIRRLESVLLIQTISRPTLIQAIDKREQAVHFTEDQLRSILPSQVPLLEDERLNQVPDSVIQQLEAEDQIKRIQGERVNILTQPQINAIHPNAVQYLDNDRISWLTRRELVQQVAPEKAAWIQQPSRPHIDRIEVLLNLPDDESLQPEQKEMLKNHFAHHQVEEAVLQKWQVAYLPDTQIGELTHPDLIRAIPAASAASITEVQAPNLRVEESALIRLLPYPPFTRVNPTLVHLLTAHQIGELQPEDETIINRLSSEQAAHLKTKALQKIDLSIVNNLHPIEIKRIENSHLIQAISQRALIQAIDKREQAVHFTDDQLRSILPSQVPLLEGERLNQVPDSVIQQLEAEDQIKRIQDERVNILTQPQIDAIHPNAVQYLDNDRISWLTRRELVQQVAPEKAAWIQQPSRPHIDRIEVLLNLPDDESLQPEQKEMLRHYFEGHQVNEAALQQWQIAYLPPAQIGELTRPDLIRAIPAASAASMTETQVPTLREKENALIRCLPYPLLTHINLTLVHLLTVDQIGELQPEDEAIIGRLSAEQAAFLQTPALQKIDRFIVNELEEREIRRLENFTLIDSLAKERVGVLTTEQIGRCDLFPAHLIDALDDECLPFLKANRENLSQVPENRRLALSDLQLNVLYVDPQDKLVHILQGTFLSTLLLPRLVVQFVTNLVLLCGMIGLSFFSLFGRKEIESQARETFISAPCRATAVLWIPFNYVRYKKIYLRYPRAL